MLRRLAAPSVIFRNFRISNSCKIEMHDQDETITGCDYRVLCIDHGAAGLVRRVGRNAAASEESERDGAL